MQLFMFLTYKNKSQQYFNTFMSCPISETQHFITPTSYGKDFNENKFENLLYKKDKTQLSNYLVHMLKTTKQIGTYLSTHLVLGHQSIATVNKLAETILGSQSPNHLRESLVQKVKNLKVWSQESLSYQQLNKIFESLPRNKFDDAELTVKKNIPQSLQKPSLGYISEVKAINQSFERLEYLLNNSFYKFRSASSGSTRFAGYQKIAPEITPEIERRFRTLYDFLIDLDKLNFIDSRAKLNNASTFLQEKLQIILGTLKSLDQQLGNLKKIKQSYQKLMNTGQWFKNVRKGIKLHYESKNELNMTDNLSQRLSQFESTMSKHLSDYLSIQSSLKSLKCNKSSTEQKDSKKKQMNTPEEIDLIKLVNSLSQQLNGYESSNKQLRLQIENELKSNTKQKGSKQLQLFINNQESQLQAHKKQIQSLKKQLQNSKNYQLSLKMSQKKSNDSDNKILQLKGVQKKLKYEIGQHEIKIAQLSRINKQLLFSNQDLNRRVKIEEEKWRNQQTTTRSSHLQNSPNNESTTYNQVQIQQKEQLLNYYQNKIEQLKQKQANLKQSYGSINELENRFSMEKSKCQQLQAGLAQTKAANQIFNQLIAQLTNQKAGLVMQLTSLRAQLNNLNSNLAEKDRIIRQFSQLQSAATSQKASSNENNYAFKVERDQLMDEKARLKEEVFKNNQKITKLQNDYQKLVSQHAKKEYNLTQTMQDWRQQQIQQSAEYQSLLAVYESEIDKTKTLTLAKQSCQHEITKLKQTLQAQKLEYKTKSQQLQSQISKLEEQIAQVISQKQRILSELQSRSNYLLQIQNQKERQQSEKIIQEDRLLRNQQDLKKNLQTQVFTLQKSLTQKQKEIDTWIAKQKDLDLKIKELDLTIKRTNQELTDEKNKSVQQLQKQNKQNQALKQTISKLQNKIGSIQILIKDRQAQLEKVSAESAESAVKLQSKNAQIDNLKQKLQTSVANQKKLRAEKELVQKQLSQQTKVSKKLEDKLQEVESQLRLANADLNNAEQQNRVKGQQLSQNQDQINQLNNKIAKLENQITKMKNEITQLLSKLKEITQKLDQTTIQLRYSINEKQTTTQLYLSILQQKQKLQAEKHQIITQFQQKLSQLNNKGEQSCEISKLPTHLLNYYQQSYKKTNPFNLLIIDQLFQGELLREQISHKQTIVEALQKLQRRPINRTKLIYQYDPRNIVSFHNYIDGTKHMLLIVKSIKGVFIAAYNSGEYNEKISITGPGLLISLRAGEVFELFTQAANKKYACRAMTYDKFYLNFGNSQVRMKWTDVKKPQLFSNFGVSNSYFNNREFKVDTLLGQGETRETLFQNFEIYQVEYRQQALVVSQKETTKYVNRELNSRFR